MEIKINQSKYDKDIMKVPNHKIKHYLDRLNTRLTNLSDILTKEKDEFVAPYLKIVQDTVKCLILKHDLEKDSPNFSLTIDPTESGFPTFKDFYLLKKDKEIADKALEKLPSKEAIIEKIRDKLLRGSSPVTLQSQLKKFNFYSKLKGTNILEEYYLNELQLVGEEGSKKLYTLEWNCIERGSNVPVFYRMYFSQDSKFQILNEGTTPKLKTIIYESQYGRRDLREIVSVIDYELDEIHPKLINKYIIGPYYNDITTNSPELNSIFGGMQDQSILKFNVEAVASISVKKLGGWIRQRLGLAIEKEVYGPLDNTNRKMIAPFRIKQKLGKKDEFGKKCKIYGITEEGIA